MSQKIGRNAPCPCGSGKKFKQCCLKKKKPHVKSGASLGAGAAGDLPAGRGFRFDPGAYGEQEFGFVPALLCEERVEGQWTAKFLLVNPARPFDAWTQAAELATHNLDAAFEAKASAGDEAAGHRLEAMGYKAVEEMHLELFHSIEAASGLGGVDFEAPEESEDGSHLRELFLNVVEEQINANEPKETALTVARLVEDGHSEAEAKELIASLVAAEMFAITTEKRAFDHELYVKNLLRLPELPEELRPRQD